MGIQREEIIVRAGFDNSALASGLRTSQSLVAGWAGRLTSYFASMFAAGGFITFGRTLLDLAEKIKLTSDRLGITTTAVQKLDYAATLGGTSLDNVATALDRIARAQTEVQQGTEQGMKFAAVFQRFGMSLAQVIKMTPEEIFERMGKSIARTGVNAQVTADAMGLMGRNAGTLLPMLKELDKLKGKAPIISEEDVHTLSSAENRIKAIVMLWRVHAEQALAHPITRHPLVQWWQFLTGTDQTPEAGAIMGPGAGRGPVRTEAFKIVDLTKQANDAHQKAVEINERIAAAMEKQKSLLQQIYDVRRRIAGAPYQGLGEDEISALNLQLVNLLGDFNKTAGALQQQIAQQQARLATEQAKQFAAYPSLKELAMGRGPFSGSARDYLSADAEQRRLRANLPASGWYFDPNRLQNLYFDRNAAISAAQQRMAGAMGALTSHGVQPENPTLVSIEKRISDLQQSLTALITGKARPTVNIVDDSP